MKEHCLLKLALSLIYVMNGCYGKAITDNLRMVWNDEFNGNTIDASKWAIPPAWFRQGGCYWSDENYETTGNGKLKLSVTESNDGTVYCGAIRTHNKFDKKYGYFETRCTVPQIHGGWAAFWMMPYQNKPGNEGNDGTEIDIFESINGWRGQINHALHWDGYGAEHKHVSKKMDMPNLYDGKYHVFGMMWTPLEYIFYIDNEETWRTSTAGVSDVNQYLKLTLEVSSQTWAGNWNDQVTKPINWFVDYVRVYDYEPISNDDVNLEFTALTNDQTFDVGDHVEMHVRVTGTMSQIDKIKFFIKKGNEPYVLEKTSDITSENTYWYNWFPDQPGTYKLKAEGSKSGVFVTNVIANAVVNGNTYLRPTQSPTIKTPNPFSMAFTSLSSGGNYDVGDMIDMSVELSGDLSDADEIQYLTRKDDGDFVVQGTQSLTGLSSYEYNWSPTESGTYTLRITATKNDSYITHIVVGGINVEQTPMAPPTRAPTPTPDPFSMAFTSLNAGDNYDVGDMIDMNVELSGDLSDADEIQYLTRKDDGDFVVQATQSLTDLSSYEYNWSPTESGTYTLRITATKNGSYVTHVVVGSVNVKETQTLDPFSMAFTSLRSGDNYEVGDMIDMSVEQSGDLSDADEIQYLTRKDDGDFVVQGTQSLTGLSSYEYSWSPTESGTYALRITATKNGSYVTHVVVGDIVVEEAPLKLEYKVLLSGSTYQIGEQIKMHVVLSGSYPSIDKLKFIVQKIGESGSVINSSVIKTETFSVDKTIYYKKWTSSEVGYYRLKVSAYFDNLLMDSVIAMVTIE